MIGRRTALTLVVGFVGFLLIPPTHQLVVELKQTGHWRFLALFREKPTHDSLKRFEETLARESDLAARARRAYQTCLVRWLGQGNDKILIGRDGFLFFHQEVEMAVGPGFLRPRTPGIRSSARRPSREPSSAAVAAIVDFDRRLRSRGIHLVFVPLPVKPFIYPEEVWPAYPVSDGPAWNCDREAFLARLAEAGVDALDVTDDLWKAKTEPGEALFLKLDTHWTPRGLAVVADRLAECVKSHLAIPAPAVYPTRTRSVTNFGDLLHLLEVEHPDDLFEPQTVEIIQVIDNGARGQGNDSAPVLLLGDSFTNIYQHKALEWGEDAGLSEQMKLRLGVDVQVIAINGGGATAVREALAQKPRMLAQKKMVIWTCSARDLFDESIAWESVPLPESDP
jgi:alginate O-acetyltransferase complex protein AlgJ